MSESLRYDQLAAVLSNLGYANEAAEYHGALCGALCVKAPDEIDPLRVADAKLKVEAGGAAVAAQTLHELRARSAESFTGTEMSFAPLLPDDETDLQGRVRALSAWCEGFLFGLSSGKPINMKQCSPEMKEIVHDFTEFTNAGIGDDEDAEVEETAYAELVEYIRVGAQLIYMEMHERLPDEARASTVH